MNSFFKFSEGTSISGSEIYKSALQMTNLDRNLENIDKPIAIEKFAEPSITINDEILSEDQIKIDNQLDVQAYSFDRENENLAKNAIENGTIYNEIYECSPEDFSFENINFESDELGKIVDYFKPNIWNNLDMNDKKAVIQGFENYLVKTIDLNHPPKMVFYSGAQGDCGAYDRRSNLIKINSNMLENSRIAINTVAHETWHAYQYQCAENPVTRKDALYAINFTNYIRPVMVDGKWILFDEYQSQLVEAEASAVGDIFESKVSDK